MTSNQRELYASSNGDRWFLGRDLSGEVVVIHHPNAASGGRVATIPVGTFLTPSNRGPEHQALRHLIGTLLDPQRLSGPDNIVDVKA